MLTRRKILQSVGVLGATGGLGSLVSSEAQATILSGLALLKYRTLVPEIFEPVPRPPTHTPVIVIGSGFGGAVSALRLAQAGLQVTVLERGAQWPTDPWKPIFSNDTLPDGRAFWRRNSAQMIAGNTAFFDYFSGVMDVVEYPNMTVWQGAAVGGGSIIFTGVMIQPPKTYFDAIFGGSVSYDEMNNVYYPRVRNMLRLSTMPGHIYNSTNFGHSRIWDQHAAKAGYSTTWNESIFNWNVVNDEIEGRRLDSAIIGMSNHGNSNAAKFDLNQNYLAQARGTGKVKIYANHTVQNIGWDGSRYTVDVIKYAVSGQQLERYVLTCDKLVLAAGSVGTSELLVKAQAKGYLPRLNEEIGKGWGSNGDTIVSRSFAPIAGLSQASPSATRIHDAQAGLPQTLENWYVPGVPIDLGIIGSLGMAFDQTNRGHFSYNPSTDKVVLNWAAAGNKDAVESARFVHSRICNANNVVSGVPGLMPEVVGMNWTAHPLGGAVLNKAIDNVGRVKGYPGLYVMDGAAIPGSTGSVNPSLTITALAERNIERVIAAGG